MAKWNLYNVAKQYIAVIENIERTVDANELMELEEIRTEWHARLIRVLKREGIPFKDREHVTRFAYYIIKESE